eukprot:Sdes_comp17449_c0_seq1m6671
MADENDLPKAIVLRIIKESLPDGISVAKDVKTAVLKASSVFVSYLAATANDCALRANHKTLTGEDVLQALEDLELSSFREPLMESLQEFRSQMQLKKLKAKSLNDSKLSEEKENLDTVNSVDQNEEAQSEHASEEEDDDSQSVEEMEEKSATEGGEDL